MSIEQIFIEQAEYLEDSAFHSWHASHPNEEAILRKLTQGGAKLISGPRGCGKTTLMLRAYNQLLNDENSAFPVYVNYKRSLSIEPLYKTGVDGTYWFNQWILLKIYQGLHETIKRLDLKIQLSVSQSTAKNVAALLEMSQPSKVNLEPISVSKLESDISLTLKATNRTRCVLLLDDAAHAFSPDQQRDFFDFFRQIKSKYVSPKAAVYPGVTNYSASFHVGHDAEQIDVWIKPDNEKYISFMRKILEARFPSEIEKSIEDNAIVVDMLCYSAFGIPRALLNMLQTLTDDGAQEPSRINFNRNDVVRAVKQHYLNTKKLFTSLEAKLPIYKKFIETGDHILANSIELIKKYNKEKPTNKQSVSIAIPDGESPPELIRIFSLLQYAGLCIPKEELVSRGEKGRFRIYTLHYAGLVDNNALIGSKSINFQSYVTAFATRDAHEFTRTRPNSLLGNLPNVAFTLSLPPCSVCNTPRLYEEAQFCVKCGNPLSTSSTYYDLLNRDILDLPLTQTRIRKIKEQSSIRKIKDILLDHEHAELLKVDRIGKFWAAKIMALAEEFVE